MVSGGLLVHGPAVTPFCPAEADYTELALARSGDRWPEPLFSAVFPASPAMLEIWGVPRQPNAPTATPSGALPGLGITLIFPDGQQFAAAPGWSDTFHQWQRFIPLDRDSTSRSPGEQTHQIFVPDNLNHMRTVQASIIQAPTQT